MIILNFLLLSWRKFSKLRNSGKFFDGQIGLFYSTIISPRFIKIEQLLTNPNISDVYSGSGISEILLPFFAQLIQHIIHLFRNRFDDSYASHEILKLSE